MMHILNKYANRFFSIFRGTHIRYAFAAILTGLVAFGAIAPASVMAAPMAAPMNERVKQNVQADIRADDSDRPKTTGQWKEEAREVEGQPLERAKRIVKESAEAVEDWAGLYPDVAERTIPAVGDDNPSTR